MKQRSAIVCLLIALFSACTVGPRYHRPRVAVPEAYRGATDSVRTISLGEAKWAQVFQDTVLQHLIGRALQANNDIHIAAARVAQAQASSSIHSRTRWY